MKDGKGRVWKEWTTPSAAGFNAFDYDLSADPALADANEEAMRKEAVEAAAKARERAAGKGGDETPKAEVKAEAKAEAEEDEDGDEAGAKATPPELLDLLADPLRKARDRYLPAGRYTVEIAAGSEKATTRLVVKAPKKEAAGGGEED